ncbi:MAG: cadherin-like beta sandwich domain-containing protein, partial [Clostridia bacterium]|nr:cadherin-like beta sandwich domain-containing protein [Clostridia bacterium]
MKKTLFAVFLAAALLFAPLTAIAAPLITTETQFNYSQSNPAWLKDLTVKENMVSATQLANSVTLEAMPDYPYSKTPEGFRSEVSYYTELYSLNENSQRAAYIYVLQYVNQFANEATRNVSDEYIKNSLTSMGIVYPQGGMGDYENLIFARSLYTLLCSGAVTLEVTEGMTVQEALVKCLAQTFRIDEQTLQAWSVSSVVTLDDYVLVVSRIALNTRGYSVRADTPPEEVYRLVAVMMIRDLGISIDENTADFEELKLKYLAALLSSHYDVSIPPAELKAAQANGNIPFYLLQLIGRKYGVSVRSDVSFSEAFNLVAANSDYFSLKEGEFYADIYHYAAYLDYKRDRIWVCPLAYRATTVNEYVSITVAGEPCASGEWAEVALDKTQESQDVLVRVRFVSASQDTSQTYRITVHQGRFEASPGSTPTVVTTDANSDFPVPTTGITDPAAAGNAALSSLTNTLSQAAVQADIPARISEILPLMTPSAETTSAAGDIAVPTTSAAEPAHSADGQSSPDYRSLRMGGGSVSFGASPRGGSAAAPTTASEAATVPVTAAPAYSGDAPMLVSQ